MLFYKKKTCPQYDLQTVILDIQKQDALHKKSLSILKEATLPDYGTFTYSTPNIGSSSLNIINLTPEGVRGPTTSPVSIEGFREYPTNECGSPPMDLEG